MKKEGVQENKQVKRTRLRAVKKPNSGKPPRLYLRAVFAGFRRGKTTQNENQALLKIKILPPLKNILEPLDVRAKC